MEKKKNQINVELKEDVASGSYSNLVIVNFSATEFVLDFASVMPGLEKAKVNSRIILTPQHTKRLYNILGENIKKYESKSGEIKSGDIKKIPLDFGGPKAQA
ncbi:MAG: hypothetical protein CBC73_02455 [Flavobacteriales bacterium TMED113]|nr:MAG: hypothetical protein CBC73_02455 [Flavobacteriales bacterium TMED113]